MSNELKLLGELLEPLNFFTKDFKERQDHIENLLCRYLNTKTVVAFIGAGASNPLGYPGWKDFARDIVLILKLIFEDEKLCESIFELPDSKIKTPVEETISKEDQEKQKEDNINDILKEHLPSLKEILKTVIKSETKRDSDKKEDEIIKDSLRIYSPIIDAVKEFSTGIKTARSNYKNLRDKHKAKNYFDHYLVYIDKTQENEINALYIFSECERVLCSEEDWKEKKQSKIFRKIVEAYFQEKYTKVKERLIEKHIENYIENQTEYIAAKQAVKETKEAAKVEKLSGDVNEREEALKNLRKKIKEEKGKEKEQLEEESSWRKILEKYNPYIALSKLPIRKFITPNYDLEIERALLYQKKITPKEESIKKLEKVYEPEKVYEYTTKDIIISVDEKSFSQVKENHRELADFSTARYEEKDYSVFHCHGRIDDFDSCVVSEEDYQKWYLKDDPQEYTPFRQTIDITLDSNPILFIGFGLKDADFMRLLRQITANRPLNKTRTPLFCLLYVGEGDIKPEESKKDKTTYKWESEDELREECTALYIKYGLHVIPVKVAEMKEPGLRKKYGDGDATCIKLLQIGDRWTEWQNGIRQKPKFRKTSIKSDDYEKGQEIEEKKEAEKEESKKEYFHYKFKSAESNKIEAVDNRLIDELKYVLEECPWFERIEENLAKDGEKQKVESKSSDVEFANRLAVVVGDGGTGKSWAVQEYLNKECKEFKRFFWSAYYSNDVMTGIDRLIDFFIPNLIDREDETKKKKNKFDLLKKIIDNKNSEGTGNENKEKRIIVFDGIEKMLIANHENTEGISVSPEIKEFFKIISHSENADTRIILTSRIFPTDILYHFESRIEREEKGDRKKELEDRKLKVRTKNVIRAPKCWKGDLLPSTKENTTENAEKDIEEFSEIGKEKTSAICSLVEGHIFGISLIRGILKDLKGNIIGVDRLIQDIANTPIDKRIQRVVEEAIKNLNRNGKYKEKLKEKLIEGFVQRIALFMHPVRKEVAKVCLNFIKETEDSVTDDLLKDLLEKSIIQEVESNNEKKSEEIVDGIAANSTGVESKKEGSVEYVVHPLIRSYVFERIHKSLFTSLPSLQLPGFSSGKETVDPGGEYGQEVAVDLFNKLCEKSTEIGPNSKIACDMCRAAFSILRSRFCSNTVARWGNYEDYVKLVVKLYDTSKRVSDHSKGLWDYKEPTDNGFKDCESENNLAPLYPDELAWVYNEIGLASQSMGNNMNAMPLWEQGYEINKLIDRNNEDGRYIFQSNFNLGAINIYYGKLRVAQDHLDKAFEIANRLENVNLSNRVLGYRALLKYLQGNLEEAENDFKAACDKLESNPRARALFYYFYGELLLKKNEWKEAEKKIEQSRHLAEAKYYPDLVLYARLAKANLLRKKELYPDSQYEYQYVLKEARAKSLFRLEASVLSGMSRLSEELGDYQSARVRAVESLKIANEYSLGLQQTVSLLVLGKALINDNLRELGISYLKASIELAKTQSYFLRLNEAERELRKYSNAN